MKLVDFFPVDILAKRPVTITHGSPLPGSVSNYMMASVDGFLQLRQFQPP